MNGSTLDMLDWATVQPRVDALQAAALTPDTVEGWLQEWSNLTAHYNEAGAQIYREVTENTTDAEAEKRFLLLVEEIMPKMQVAEQALKEKLLALEGYTPSPDTEQMVKRFRTEAAIFRAENVPLQSELAKLGNEYDKIVGAMSIEWDGTEETLPQAELHLQEHDRATRERAWRLIMARWAQERERLNELYLQMLKLRQQMGRNAGFANFREYQWQALGRFDYTPADAATFHDAIEQEVVPLAREAYEAQRARLGLEQLRPWDSPWEAKYDPHGEPLAPFRDAAELEEGGYRIFQQVDPELAEYYTVMRDGYLDLASRPNKAPGGYCNSFPVSGKPYIFMNAVGTNRDVNTLLHEGGHAFHFMESRAQPLVWNQGAPMEFCEVASMSMELLSAPYLERSKGGFYSEADARRAYAQGLRDNAVLFLPYMAVVDSFQHWVYAEAPDDVTAADLDRKWGELWDRFMQGADYTGLEAEKMTGWHRKGHIFTVPFYYIEYGLAQLGALQVWRNALSDQAKAVQNYRAALALGDTRPLPDLFSAAGATFAFDRQTVGGLMTLVREQLETLEG